VRARGSERLGQDEHCCERQLRLDAGAVRVDGEAVRFARPGRVSYLAQTKPLHHSLRAGDVVDYAALLAAGRFDRALAYGWLDRYDIDPSGLVGDLSGGERAQVALAAAVARRSSVVLLDEPMASLDPLAQQQVAADLQGQAMAGRVVVVSSHATAELEAWCDHLVVVDAGRVVLCGPVAEVAAGARLSDVVVAVLTSARARRAGPAMGGAARSAMPPVWTAGPWRSPAQRWSSIC